MCGPDFPLCGPGAAGVSRRRFLATAGAGAAGAAALALGPAVPALAQAAPRGPRRLRLHVISDTHVSDVYPMTMQDMRVSLDDLWSVAPEPDALVVVGDLVEYGHVQDYPLFDLTLASSTHRGVPLLGIGNHEYHAGDSAAVMRQRFLSYANRGSVYFATEAGGIPLIFLGSEGIVPGETSPNAWTALISTAQLDWLESTLASVARPDRPSFVFLHQPPENVDTGSRLTSILQAAPNVVFFWGHWHSDLNWFTQGPDVRLLGNSGGYWRVHTAATTYLWQYQHQPDGSVSQTFKADFKQGLLVDVYDGAVVVRGRDFLQRAWVPGFRASIPVGAVTAG